MFATNSDFLFPKSMQSNVIFQKYHRSTSSGCKDICITKSEFAFLILGP